MRSNDLMRLGTHLTVAKRLVRELDIAEMTLVNFADLLVCGRCPWQGTRRGTEPNLCQCSMLYLAMATAGGGGQLYAENCC